MGTRVAYSIYYITTNSWDVISDIYRWYNGFKAFESSVQEAKTIEEADKVADGYRYMV